MADITHFPFVRHLRGAPDHARPAPRSGRAVHEGAGAVVLVPAAVRGAQRGPGRRPRAAAALPRPHRRLPGRHRAGDGHLPGHRSRHAPPAPRLLDRPAHGPWRATPLEQVAGLLTELAQQHALELLARQPLAEALAAGPGAVREPGSRPASRATRACADDGITVRRASASWRSGPSLRSSGRCRRPPGSRCSRRPTGPPTSAARWPSSSERAIAENELQNQIELARREEQLVAQRGAQRAASGRGARPPRNASRPRRGRARRGSWPRAARPTRPGSWRQPRRRRARAARATATCPQTLLGLALQELAGSLPEIDTPHALARLSATPGARPAQRGTRHDARAPRAVVVHRRTELDELLARHGTRGQARVLPAHARAPLAERDGAPRGGRRRRWPRYAPRSRPTGGARQVERADLDRFLFDAGGRRRRGRPGRARRERREVPRRPTGDRRQPRAGPQPGRAGADRAADVRRGPARAVAAGTRGSSRARWSRRQSTTASRSSRSTRSTSATRAISPRATGSPPTAPRSGSPPPGCIVGTGTGATGWCRSIWRQPGRHVALPVPGGAAARLVRPRGMAVARDRHLAHRGRARPATSRCGSWPRPTGSSCSATGSSRIV